MKKKGTILIVLFMLLNCFASSIYAAPAKNTKQTVKKQDSVEYNTVKNYSKYYNYTYKYSMNVPESILDNIIENNQSSIMIPYSSSIFFKGVITGVRSKLSDDDIKRYAIDDVNKVSLGDKCFENTYNNDKFMKTEAENIVMTCNDEGIVSSIDKVDIKNVNSYKIKYNMYDEKVISSVQKDKKTNKETIVTNIKRIGKRNGI